MRKFINKPPKINTQKGFTIIELMIATTVFSIVLLVAGSGIIAIGKMYYKTITSSRVQDAARSTMEDVTRSLQFSSGNVSSYMADTTYKVRCFGDDRYTYVLNQPASSTTVGLRLDKTPNGGCSLDTPPDGKELLGNNMRLLQFDVSTGHDSIFTVKIKVAQGDNDLLTTYDQNGNPVGWSPPVSSSDEAVIAGTLCRGGVGSAFCSVSGLETVVNKRIIED